MTALDTEVSRMQLITRKKIELKTKLSSLQQELAEWRAKSKESAPLEKHNSQIHRVTVRLEGLQKQMLKELSALEGDSSRLLSGARELEEAALEAHRVWEFFRSKLGLRSVEWFSRYLTAADDLAWDCYSAAQAKLTPGYLPPHHIKEPPLVFFNGGSSPFTQARGEAFEAEAVPDEELKTVGAKEVLRALPIPVIGVPWFQVQHLPEALVIAHEVGHDVETDFKLTPDLNDALEACFVEADIGIARRDAWRAWLGEIFADMYGALACGPAFVGALMDFLATDPGQVQRAQRQAPNWGFYPTDYLRVLLNLELLRQQGFQQDRDTLYREWTSTYGSHGMTEYEQDIEKIVRAIITKSFAVFGGRRLPEVISFSALEQATALTDAERILGGWAPQTNNVRTLFAATRLAFSSNPEIYDMRDVNTLVLDGARRIRRGGVRNRQAASEAPVGSLDVQDEAAGAELLSLLRRPAARS